MKFQSLLFTSCITLFLSACGNIPLSPGELRQLAIKNQSFASTETFTVHRSYKKVITTIKNRAYQCLRKSVKTTVTQGGTKTNEYSTPFKPTFVKRHNMSELHVQMKRGNTIVIAGNKDKIGKDGWYVVVTDIHPGGAGRTRLDIHHAPGMGIIVNAIHNWAKGTNLGCPDLTKVK